MKTISEINDKIKNLKNRYEEPSLFGINLTKEELRKNIVDLIGTSEDWKIRLSDYIKKINLPFTDEETVAEIEHNGEIVKINLDLRGIDLSYERFTMQRFREYAYIKNIDDHKMLIGELSDMHLDYADMTGVHIDGIEMKSSSFNFAKMNNLMINNSKITSSSFIGVTMNNSKIVNSDLTFSLMIMSELVNTEFKNSNIEDTDFFGSMLKGVRFLSCRLNAHTHFAVQEIPSIEKEALSIYLIDGKKVYGDKKGNALFVKDEITRNSEKLKSETKYKYLGDELRKDITRDDWREIKEVYRQIKLMMREFGFYMESDYYFFLELRAKRKSDPSLFYRILTGMVEYFTGYGIKMERMVRLAVFNILSFALIYFIDFRHLLYSYKLDTEGISIGERAARSIYFSIVTFSTVGYGDLHPIGYLRFVANLEAIFGVLVTGLFVVTITRKFTGN